MKERFVEPQAPAPERLASLIKCLVAGEAMWPRIVCASRGSLPMPYEC